MTSKVMALLDSLNIEGSYVPANMTHFFQPLHLTVNRSAKEIYYKTVYHIMQLKCRNSFNQELMLKIWNGQFLVDTNFSDFILYM